MDYCSEIEYMPDDFSINKHHGFYATNEMLGIPEMTDREMREYKRLIGMPDIDSYEDLMDSLIVYPQKTESKKRGRVLMKVFGGKYGKK